MKASSQRTRRAFLWSATAATAAAMIIAGSTAEAAHTSPHAGAGHGRVHPDALGPGYPPPGGIYTPFTNCPLLKPLMLESVGGSATGCVAGDAVSGSIKIGNVTTTVAHPVIAQFGIWDPPNAEPNQFSGGVLPPFAGLSAQLVSSPEYVPGGLLKALGCPSTNATVENLCQEATYFGGKYLNVYAKAQSAGQITNFDLTTWTQPLKFKLINPLLGSSCYIGSDDNPVVVNPNVTGTLVEENDPNPKRFPDVGVLAITDGTATDTTFSAPVVTGCGPGGAANIPVDEAIDTSVGLPSASGNNSLTLNGNFYLGVSFAPRNMANNLLAAFKASEGKPAPSVRQEAAHRISAASLRDGRYGIR
jgi:hypothetical protein